MLLNHKPHKMSRRTVHVFSEITGLLKELCKNCPNIRFKEITIPKLQEFDEKVLHELDNAEILISDPHVGLYVDKLPNLKWLQLTWAGVDKIAPYFKDIPSPPYLITRFGGAFGLAMSEYVLGNIIANERRFKVCWERQKDHVWLNDIQYRTLHQLTLGILGYGDIGQCVARICKALGMTVWAMGRSPRDHLPDNVDKYVTTSGLEDLLKSCDYVCNILPSTPNTKNLLSGNVLQACQSRHSCFINVGRGDVIDEGSLVNALKKGWISGAVLDVTETEPLPKESELWEFPGVRITPHCSAISFSSQVAETFVKNLNLYDKGKTMDFIVDVKRGY